MVRLGMIYCLSDPRTGEVRYIGQTIRGLGQRLSSHISMAKYSDKKYPVYKWINELLEVNLAPKISVIEKDIPSNLLSKKESYWIMELSHRENVNLTNISIVGRYKD